MYISLNWINDFIKLPSKIKTEKISEELTQHTVEVEGFFDQTNMFKGVVVGKVLETRKHPNADKLQLAVVDINNEKLEIVCGASNLKTGQLVPVAQIGAVLPNGLEMKEVEIRGEKSCGMICAEDELGLGNEHEGIMVLDKKAKTGQSFAQYLKYKDTILEIDNKSLSNRPDLLSHYGIAREFSAIFDTSLKPYSKFVDDKIQFTEEKLKVKVEEKDLCPRYMAVKISNIVIKESPQWLKDRLIAVNQKPINNIVDLTNYIMLETGQALHAFDANKVDEIIVRLSKKGEKIKTLDDKERELDEKVLVIADSKNPIAVAGIMGGVKSEIDEKTTSIILEAANFDAQTIRQGSQSLGLRTEASTRFEKSLDHHLSPQAIYRFIFLLKKLDLDYKIDSELVDINNTLDEEKSIDLDLEWLNKKIGQEIPKEMVKKILSRLGFEIIEKENNIFSVKIPSWRATKDISIKEDLVEEVLRLYGYDKIKSKLPTITLAVPIKNELRTLERKLKNILYLKYSLNEMYNYSFLGEDQLKKLNIDFSNYLTLANPLSGIHKLLRQTLIPGLIANVKTNQAQSGSLRFFEIARLFMDIASDVSKNKEGTEFLPYQEDYLGIALADDNKQVFDKLKSLVVNLLQNILSSDVKIEFIEAINKSPWADDHLATYLIINGQKLGEISLISSQVENNLNLKKKVAVLEIGLNNLLKLYKLNENKEFKGFAKFPQMIRDLAFVVDKKVMYNDLQNSIKDFHNLISKVELFDVYEGNKLENNQKSLAFHVYYQSEEKTLTKEEVDNIQKELITTLDDKFNAKLRDF